MASASTLAVFGPSLSTSKALVFLQGGPLTHEVVCISIPKPMKLQNSRRAERVLSIGNDDISSEITSFHGNFLTHVLLAFCLWFSVMFYKTVALEKHQPLCLGCFMLSASISGLIFMVLGEGVDGPDVGDINDGKFSFSWLVERLFDWEKGTLLRAWHLAAERWQKFLHELADGSLLFAFGGSSEGQDIGDSVQSSSGAQPFKRPRRLPSDFKKQLPYAFLKKHRENDHERNVVGKIVSFSTKGYPCRRPSTFVKRSPIPCLTAKRAYQTHGSSIWRHLQMQEHVEGDIKSFALLEPSKAVEGLVRSLENDADRHVEYIIRGSKQSIAQETQALEAETENAILISTDNGRFPAQEPQVVAAEIEHEVFLSTDKVQEPNVSSAPKPGSKVSEVKSPPNKRRSSAKKTSTFPPKNLKSHAPLPPRFPSKFLRKSPISSLTLPRLRSSEIIEIKEGEVENQQPKVSKKVRPSTSTFIRKSPIPGAARKAFRGQKSKLLSRPESAPDKNVHVKSSAQDSNHVEEQKETESQSDDSRYLTNEIALADLSTYTLQKLKSIAKEKGAKGYSKLKKGELIDLLKNLGG